MQLTTIAATAILAAIGLAAPNYADHGKEMAYFTFQGAADAQFPFEVPVDNTFKEISESALSMEVATPAPICSPFSADTRLLSPRQRPQHIAHCRDCR